MGYSKIEKFKKTKPPVFFEKRAVLGELQNEISSN